MAPIVGRSLAIVGGLALGACGPVIAPPAELGGSSTTGVHADDASESTTLADAASSTGDGPDPLIPDATSSTGLVDTSTTTGTDATSTTDPDTTTGAPIDTPTATYLITIHNTWSQIDHPGAVPPDAHFSWLGGATHDPDFHLWREGELASPGMVFMAEIGNTNLLVAEAMTAIANGEADQALEWQQWFCPPVTTIEDCGPETLPVTISREMPALTLVSMLGPSPDLFVGIDGLVLHDGVGWLPLVELELHPYDGGSRSDTDFTMNGAQTIPREPIHAIVSTDQHVLGPGSLGTMRLELQVEPG